MNLSRAGHFGRGAASVLTGLVGDAGMGAAIGFTRA